MTPNPEFTGRTIDAYEVTVTVTKRRMAEHKTEGLVPCSDGESVYHQKVLNTANPEEALAIARTMTLKFGNGKEF